MRSIYFTDEHEAFRHEVRRFLVNEVAPHAADWEAARRIPRAVFARMGELGFLGITAPEGYGGAGADVFFAVAFLEELPRSMMGGFCAAVSVQQFMATPHIARAGSEYLRQRYLVPSIAGRKVGALAITEPDSGSDVAAIRTTARRDGDAYVIDGAKTFITNGADGDFYTLAVRTGPDGAAGISLIVVDADTPGVQVASRLEKLGWHASDTAELTFADARVPVTHRIGEEGSGFYQIMESFALERLCAAAIAVGSADVALEESLRHMGARRAFGRRLDQLQALRHRVADLAAELEAARQLTHHVAWLIGQGEPAIRESAMAKLVATELGKRVADECLQFFGGYGYMEEYPVARFFRDARGGTITAGTSEIMREIVARVMIDEFAPAARVESVPPRPAKSEAPAPTPASAPTSAPAADPGAPPTVESVMRSLPQRVRDHAADGWSGVFHFVLRGANPPEWTVHVADGGCTVRDGLAGQADCVVQMKEKTFLGLRDGSVNPQTAFLLGRIKVSNLSLMLRFLKAFRLRG